MSEEPLPERSVRTLAWLGDAEFEREVRVRLARRGDFPTDRLHAMKTRVVCAEAQAELLATLEPVLDEAEAGVVRRARNLNVKAGGRGVRSARDYRSSTALEALVAQHPNVERVLCGHVHRSIQVRFGGTLALTVSSPAHQVCLDLAVDAASAWTLEPPGFGLHALAPGGRLVSHTVPCGEYPGPFAFHESGQLID